MNGHVQILLDGLIALRNACHVHSDWMIFYKWKRWMTGVQTKIILSNEPFEMKKKLLSFNYYF